MYTTMMPPLAAPETRSTLTVPVWLAQLTPAALAAIGITEAEELFAPGLLAGETLQEREVRLVAAADVLDDRLAEIADQTLTSEVVRGWGA